jgi:hypothetical protein
MQLILFGLLMNDNDHVTSMKVGLLEIVTRTQIYNEFRPKFYFSIKVHINFHFINVIEEYTTAYCKIWKFGYYSLNIHIHREIHEFYHMASSVKLVYSYKSRPILHSAFSS